ncbi:hypothetical protein BKA64DRAFT_713652 [Cadophora sp. MPI-SDFR-AT-0126]|nr:hypothetical protein BKA64DRAFT_713652 [Leotiomycetes sp. MPI-SDFR-AT-0126]
MANSDNRISDLRAIPASSNLTPEDSTINIQRSCEPQQSKSSSEPRKHGFAGGIEDLGNQCSKRFKASPDSPSLPVRSPHNSQHSGSVVMYGNTGKMATGQVQPGKPGDLSPREYQLQLMLLEHREKTLRMMARQGHDGHSSMSGYKLGDGPNYFASDRVNRIYQADSINKGIGSPNRYSAIAAQPSVAQASMVDLVNHQPVSAHPSTHRVEEALQSHRERIDKIPEAQQEDIQHGREKTMSMMQLEVKELDFWLEECQKVMQEKRAQIKLEGRMKSLKGSTPEVIKILKALVIQLPDL